MALNIKSPEADALAERLERLKQKGRHAMLRSIRDRLAALPVVDGRDADTILGYDGDGLSYK